MPWTKPADYKPRADLKNYLEMLSPKMHTPEMDMVIYWQWVHHTLKAFKKTPKKAWDDLNMTPANARQAIANKIVPAEIFEFAAKRAMEE